MQFRLISSLIILALISGTSWAQSTIVERLPDPALIGGGVANGQFTDRGGEEVVALTQITITEEVEVGSVTVYMTNLFENYPVGSSGNAILSIWVGDTLPLGANTLTGGPLGNNTTTVDYVATANGLEVTANGLEITLPPSNYLVGLTPILNYGTNSQEFLQDAGPNGATTFLDNPGGAFFDLVFDSSTVDANEADLPTTFTGMAITMRSTDSGLKGDVNQDGVVNLLDVGPFIDVLSSGVYQVEADTNCDGTVDLLDVGPFIDLLGG